MNPAWTWAGARAIGTAHVQGGLALPGRLCLWVWRPASGPEILIAALADGAGSAERAEAGATLATSIFVDIVRESFEDGAPVTQAAKIIRYATEEARAAVAACARHAEREIADYASTLLVAVLHPGGGAVGQIGDGAVVASNGGERSWRPLLWPDHGEYVNTTRFLTDEDALAHLRIEQLNRPVGSVCLFSDGLERLVLDFRARTAHAPFFDAVFRRFGSEPGVAMPRMFRMSLASYWRPTPSTGAPTTISRFCAPCCWGSIMAQAARRKVDPTALVAQQAFAGTLTGSAYRLGAEVGSGGEGIIHAVVRRPELLAKVYRRPPSRYEIDKLDALVQAATPDLLSVAAWPTDCLKNPSGLVIGFVMPRVLDARALYDLYGPRSRVQHFPSADFRFLVHVAGNIARLFGAVHMAGFIIGDVNHGNILVRNDGTVAAVDCDSVQIGDGARFPCRVGTDLFVPPELLGKNFDAVRRTPNHDAFGSRS